MRRNIKHHTGHKPIRNITFNSIKYVRTAYSNAFAAAPQESATSKHVLRRMQYCSATFPGFTIRYLEEEE